MLRYLIVWLIIGMALTLASGDGTAASKPEGQLVIAFDTSIAPTYLDPAETPGTATPFTFLYALHDALIKPLPGNDMAPSLAESWRESDDGLTYEFKLREGLPSTTAIHSRRTMSNSASCAIREPRPSCCMNG